MGALLYPMRSLIFQWLAKKVHMCLGPRIKAYIHTKTSTLDEVWFCCTLLKIVRKGVHALANAMRIEYLT